MTVPVIAVSIGTLCAGDRLIDIDGEDCPLIDGAKAMATIMIASKTNAFRLNIRMMLPHHGESGFPIYGVTKLVGKPKRYGNIVNWSVTDVQFAAGSSFSGEQAVRQWGNPRPLDVRGPGWGD